MGRLATLFFAAVCCGQALAPGSAAADQKDPRLDALFAVLQEARDLTDALGPQNAIWEIWIETDDPEAEAMMSAGIAAMDAGTLKSALAIYDVMVERWPDFAEAWNKRATVHYLLGNYRESLADIERTLALEPRHFGAISGRGLVQHALGDDLAAIRSFEQALAIHPNMPSVRQNLEALKARQQPI